MDNQEIHNELHGFDFELIRRDFENGEMKETSLKTSSDITETFDLILIGSTKYVNKLKKKVPKVEIEIISTEYGCEIFADKQKVQEYFIKELEKEKVS